jgi:predicted transcriptional regulator
MLLHESLTTRNLHYFSEKWRKVRLFLHKECLKNCEIDQDCFNILCDRLKMDKKYAKVLNLMLNSRRVYVLDIARALNIERNSVYNYTDNLAKKFGFIVQNQTEPGQRGRPKIFFNLNLPIISSELHRLDIL